MRVFYSRISTSDGSQNPERQLQKIDGFDYVFTDTCSGSIPLWERPKGKQIKTLLDSNKLTHLEVHSIDRLGRDTISVLKLWKELTELGIRLVCRNPNFQNLNEDGKTDMSTKKEYEINEFMDALEYVGYFKYAQQE